MLVIFIGSTDLMSSEHTSRFIVPFLRWLKPDISDATLRMVQMIVRKGAHTTEYAVLAVLAWRAFRQSGVLARWGWRWSATSAALVLATLYAVSDETHQSFHASRYGSGWDVLIDTVGACAGLLLARGIECWRNGRQAGISPPDAACLKAQRRARP
jgi:VanZ family protein